MVGDQGGYTDGGYAGDEPVTPVTGGDPTDLTSGHLVLCARSDRDPRSFYSGLISNLAIFTRVRGCMTSSSSSPSFSSS